MKMEAYPYTPTPIFKGGTGREKNPFMLREPQHERDSIMVIKYL
jgi:hypothetical protein